MRRTDVWTGRRLFDGARGAGTGAVAELSIDSMASDARYAEA